MPMLGVCVCVCGGGGGGGVDMEFTQITEVYMKRHDKTECLKFVLFVCSLFPKATF